MLTKVTIRDPEDGAFDEGDTTILCGAHFLPRWKAGEVEIIQTDIPDDAADCEDCHFKKYLGKFLYED